MPAGRAASPGCAQRPQAQVMPGGSRGAPAPRGERGVTRGSCRREERLAPELSTEGAVWARQRVLGPPPAAVPAELSGSSVLQALRLSVQTAQPSLSRLGPSSSLGSPVGVGHAPLPGRPQLAGRGARGLSL